MKPIISKSLKQCFLGVCLLVLASTPLQARTITIDDRQITHMAVISAEVPLSSWVGSRSTLGVFTSNLIEMIPGRRLLLQFPLENIPQGQRIVSAQLTFDVTYAPYDSQRLFIWRMLKPWGLGVNHTMSTQIPKPMPWSSPGADAPGVDRALTPTANFRVPGAGEQVIDVTQDVELWYSGIVANNGWVMALDEGNQYLRLASPLYNAGPVFILRITYEPE